MKQETLKIIEMLNAECEMARDQPRMSIADFTSIFGVVLNALVYLKENQP